MPQAPTDQPRVIGPPFRADCVNSLLRPPDQLRGREDAAAAKMVAGELSAVAGGAIATAVRREVWGSR